jgi:hypothetical protein
MYKRASTGNNKKYLNTNEKKSSHLKGEVCMWGNRGKLDGRN